MNINVQVNTMEQRWTAGGIWPRALCSLCQIVLRSTAWLDLHRELPEVVIRSEIFSAVGTAYTTLLTNYLHSPSFNEIAAVRSTCMSLKSVTLNGEVLRSQC